MIKTAQIIKIVKKSVRVFVCMLTGYVVILMGIICGYIASGDSEVPDADRFAQIKDLAEWMPVDSVSVNGYFCVGDTVYFWPEGNEGSRESYSNPIAGADRNSFRIARGTLYAKDCKNVYIATNSTTSVDYDENAPADVLSVFNDGAIIIKGADPQTFKYIGNDLGVDLHRMYDSGRQIRWSNILLDLPNWPTSGYESADGDYHNSFSVYNLAPLKRLVFLGNDGLPSIRPL